MTRYTVTNPWKVLNRECIAVYPVRASRSAAHLVSDSALGARERDGARSSEASEPLSAVAPATKPMPTSRRRLSLPETVGG